MSVLRAIKNADDLQIFLNTILPVVATQQILHHAHNSNN